MLTDCMIETRLGAHFISEGVLHIVFKKGVDVGLEDMQESKQARIELQQEKKMKVLVDATDLTFITDEARAFAAQKENAAMSEAMAIVSRSLPITILTNFFIKFNKPETPTRMFRDRNSALNWLKTI
ncbi:MAG: STAS/SEC14 domain-containing protein [Flavobacteriales bacterium]|nr:STAS/SEC14 domain-containing protein [Flavobacteriales bacterium]